MYHMNQFLKTLVFKGPSEAGHMDSGNPKIPVCPTQPSFPGDATCKDEKKILKSRKVDKAVNYQSVCVL